MLVRNINVKRTYVSPVWSFFREPVKLNSFKNNVGTGSCPVLWAKVKSIAYWTKIFKKCPVNTPPKIFRCSIFKIFDLFFYSKLVEEVDKLTYLLKW